MIQEALLSVSLLSCGQIGSDFGDLHRRWNNQEDYLGAPRLTHKARGAGQNQKQVRGFQEVETSGKLGAQRSPSPVDKRGKTEFPCVAGHAIGKDSSRTSHVYVTCTCIHHTYQGLQPEGVTG